MSNLEDSVLLAIISPRFKVVSAMRRSGSGQYSSPDTDTKTDLAYLSAMQVMTEKQYYSTGAKWEPIVGYSRAIRVGGQVFVTGTTATDERGEIGGVGGAYLQ